ncbi:MAG TPA: hypothetical protein VGF28_15285 [Thermoanaerobaculia bacterium]|jgi:hypothetical protein
MQDDRTLIQSWQSQSLGSTIETAEEMLRRVKALDRRRRRATVDSYVVVALVFTCLFTLAAASRDHFMRAGALLALGGFGYVTYVLRRGRPDEGGEPEPSIRVYTAELQRQLGFARHGVWAALAAIVPGATLFSAGLAREYPQAAVLVYLQVAILVAVAAAIGLHSRRKVRALRGELAELQQLEAVVPNAHLG